VEKKFRLNQFLSRCGAASRRKADDLIASGAVKVNGVVAAHPGMRVDPSLDKVQLEGKTLHLARRVTLVFHKPKGTLCARSDPRRRKTIYDVLPHEIASLPVQSVGRLDFDSSGLLILTSDGDLHRLLEHPSSNIERIYQVKARGELDSIRQTQLLEGVELEDGPARAARVEVIRVSNGISVFRVSLFEGRNREVRRMCQAVGLEVLELKRVEYGPFRLGNLLPGQWRDLTSAEQHALDRLEQHLIQRST